MTRSGRAAPAPQRRSSPEGRRQAALLVAAGTFLLTLYSGFGFYNLTVYLRALTVEQGFSVGAVSGPTGIYFFAVGVSGLGMARLLDRFPARAVVALSAVGAGATLAGLGQVRSVWQAYVAYALLGITMAGLSVLPVTTILTRRFRHRRAMAIAVATSGLSLGGMVVTPVSAALIARYGLATTAPWLGAALLLALPVALLAIRDVAGPARPAPEPLAPLLPAERPTPWVRKEPPALTGRFFVAGTLAFFGAQLAGVGGMSHQFNHVSASSSTVVGALAVSALAGASLLGRLLGGAVVERIGTASFTVALLVVQAAGLVCLALADAPVLLVAGSVVLGLSVGNLLMMESLVIAEAYRVRDYPRVFSVQQFLIRIGSALGPMLLGVTHDFRGYREGYLLAAALTLVAIALVRASYRGAMTGGSRPGSV